MQNKDIEQMGYSKNPFPVDSEEWSRWEEESMWSQCRFCSFLTSVCTKVDVMLAHSYKCRNFQKE